MNEKTVRLLLAHEMMQLEPLGINDITVIDANGVVKYTAAAPDLEGADFSWRAYFQEIRQAPFKRPYCVDFIQFKGVDRGSRGGGELPVARGDGYERSGAPPH